MIELTIDEILKSTGGSLVNGSEEKRISGISIDSRTIKPGELFIALNGENHKGADFIEEALKKGAVGYIVENSLQALQDIAHHILQRVKPKVIGITGSTGKTSVKDMLSSVLSQKYEVIASQANYNNEVGLPLTLLRLKPSTEIVILEMAMRGFGQIEALCKIAPPDLAAITNIGQSHIELLQSNENVIKAKSEIIEGLKENGTLFLNADDKTTKILLERRGDVITFGSDKKADVYFANPSFDDLARPTFELTIDNRQSTIGNPISLPIPGTHHVINACCAAAIAIELGLNREMIKKGLENVKLSPGRLDISQTGGLTVINDSYNASPSSMRAALEVLDGVKAEGKVAVLGDMRELGNIAEEEHLKLGRKVAASGIDKLLTVGDLGEVIAKGALQAGMPKEAVSSFRDSARLEEEIISYLAAGNAILIKASRALKLETIAHYLQKHWPKKR